MNDVQEDILNDIIEQPATSSIGKRIAAAIIDGLILLLVLIIMGNLFGDLYKKTTTTTTTVTTTDSASPTITHEVTTSRGFNLEGWPVLGCMVCWFFLVPFKEGRDGQTIGKKVLRIKVVRSNGDPTNMGTSFVRHLFDCADCFLLIGLIIALTNPKRQRIGDLVAGSYVVDKQ